MIELILDTDIWIHKIAMDKPIGIFNHLKDCIDSSEIIILSNEIILDEWKRNKTSTINEAEIAIKKQMKGKFVTRLEKKRYLQQKDKPKEESLIALAKIRIESVEKMITDAKKTEITDKMKLQVVDWAIEKKAPFTIKKNSVADALIILSAIEHRRNKRTKRFSPKAYFITYNHTDYANPANKDLIHPDLKKMLEKANIHYNRHIDTVVLDLVPNHLGEIENYIELSIGVQEDERRGMNK